MWAAHVPGSTTTSQLIKAGAGRATQAEARSVWHQRRRRTGVGGRELSGCVNNIWVTAHMSWWRAQRPAEEGGELGDNSCH